MEGLLHMEGEKQLVDILKSLEEDQVDSPFQQRPDLRSEALLTINLLLLGPGGRNPERTNAARHEGSPGSLSG